MAQAPGGGRPPTFDQMYHLPEGGFWAGLQRDWRLAKFLLMTLIFWSTKGRRIRRAYAETVARGERFVLDDNFRRML
jgi:hypothetical protein